MLLSEVQRVFEKHGVTSVLVACSGGIDSVVLADLAVEYLGISKVVLGHVDHAIRPHSSEDADWVQAFGARLGVSVLSARLPPGPSDEARLRTERYAALRRQKEQADLGFVLTAHHQGDQAETVLMNLIRGTQWPSLVGISERRDDVLRPLLRVEKREILDYAKKRGLRWRDDLSNREPHYLRNRIRKELLPLMETRYRSGFSGRLARLAGDIRAAMASGELAAGAGRPSTPIQVRPGNKRAAEALVPRSMPKVGIEKRPWGSDVIPSDPSVAVFDSSIVTDVYVRRHRPGDRIRPFGMDGSKKLQDVFTDAKIPKELRPWLLVVVDGQDRVLWVPGIVRSMIAPVSVDTSEVWWCRSAGQHSCDQTTDG